MLRPNGEIRWCIGTAAASVDAAGKVVRVSGVTIDVTDRKEAEERQVLLAREVDHRARNALAVIQSIIRLTRAKTVDDYVQAIEGRIKALARAHTLLSDSRWHGADLATLVADEMAPYRAGDKVKCGGPDISLQPATAQGLALALHELATNAAKHGALSSPGGKITLDWQLETDALNLNWTENGGPRITQPSQRSFGLKVIVASDRAAARRQERRSTGIRKGLRCVFSIPRSELTKSRAVEVVRNGGEADGAVDRLEDAREAARAAGRGRGAGGDDDPGNAGRVRLPGGRPGLDRVRARWPRRGKVISTPRCSTSISATGSSIRWPKFWRSAACRSCSSPATMPTASIPRFSGVPVLQKPIERDMLQRIFLPSADRAALAS